jgi:hypothetical protein
MHLKRHLTCRFLFLRILPIGLIALAWGCKTTGPVTRSTDTGPQKHLWQPLTTVYSEEMGFGMYTYVLFGRKLNPVSMMKPETLDRYERLLEAIHLSTLSRAEGGRLIKADTNLFLIPLVAAVEAPDRHSYNAAISLHYISLCGDMVRDHAPEVSDDLATGEGPFLISTPAPLAKMGGQSLVMLYADLSTTNAAAMDEIVSAYKRRITRGISDVERFTSLRLALLDIVLDADDHIQIVKSALAQD